MNKCLLGLLTVIILVMPTVWPQIASAHGGVEKSSGNTTVFLSQSPLSPLVGEKVNMTFVIGRPGTSTERLSGLDVLITVTQSGSTEAEDKQIYITHQTTDANGAVVLDYTFMTEGYFDVDLSYTDPQNNNSAEETGFLVQTRSLPQAATSTTTTTADKKTTAGKWLIIFVIGFLVGSLVRGRQAKT